MNRIVKVLALICLLAGISGSVASAQSACNIGNTGPGSINTCTVNNNNSVTVVCVNGNQVTNDLTQTATSGLAVVNTNTTGGGANSGNANNVASIANQLAQYCAAPIGGQGAGNVQTPATPAGGQGAAETPVKTLPNTGSNAVSNIILSTIGTLSTIALASHIGLAIRSRRTI